MIRRPRFPIRQWTGGILQTVSQGRNDRGRGPGNRYWRYESRLPDEPRIATDRYDTGFRPDQREPMMSVVRGRDRAASLERALVALGGVETFVKPGDRVLIKVKRRLCLAAGALRHHASGYSLATYPPVFQGRSGNRDRYGQPINDPASCFALTGLEEASRVEGARVIIPGPSDFRPLSVTGGTLIRDWPFLYTLSAA